MGRRHQSVLVLYEFAKQQKHIHEVWSLDPFGKLCNKGQPYFRFTYISTNTDLSSFLTLYGF